ncbi:hypothetical protein ADIS_0602 [Lunatimonas lonarensis]|uniref:Uncharacterized protein n=1 Tax=Lunatimonas lonarensis TaxID=1232681 RepID=R7ZX17_9BACT|nr:hypothetical protein ADIS_0602 [Lunatimonas lonarensis]
MGKTNTGKLLFRNYSFLAPREVNGKPKNQQISESMYS